MSSPPFPTCCQTNGHCGWDCDDVPPPAPDPVPAAPARPLLLPDDNVPRAPSVVSGGGVRDDGRCGPEFPLEDGSPAACDPDSTYFCCSAHGYCGGTGEHCSCETCVNYKPSGGEQRLCLVSSGNIASLGGGGGGPLTVSGAVRSDRRCGAEFPLEDGTPSGCDGSSEVWRSK